MSLGSAASTLDTHAFDALFDTFRSTVTRLEMLPLYSVGGAEQDRIRAWKLGKPRPVRSVRTSPWLARIATSTLVDGKAWSRIRVVDDPLTEYQHYQLGGYLEAQAAGDQVSILDRTRAAKVVPDPLDFWLFDAHTDDAHAVLMHYDVDGHLERRELVTDAGTVAVLADRVDELAEIATPLNEFLASRRG